MNLFEKQQNEFTGRHIGPGPKETTEMLATIGVGSLDELIRKTIPDSIRIQGGDYVNEFKLIYLILADLLMSNEAVMRHRSGGA